MSNDYLISQFSEFVPWSGYFWVGIGVLLVIIFILSYLINKFGKEDKDG